LARRVNPPCPARRHAAWHSAAPPRAPADATDTPSPARCQNVARLPAAADRLHQPTAPARAGRPNRVWALLPPIPSEMPSFYPQARRLLNSSENRSSVADVSQKAIANVGWADLG